MTQIEDAQLEADAIYIPDHRLDILPSARWVRAQFAGKFIGDSHKTFLGRESGHWLREYYFPPDSVRMDLLEPSDHTTHSPTFGQARYWHIRVGDRVAKNAARSYPDPLPNARQIKDYVHFDWYSMDAWYEEDDQIYRHARDPFKRIDVLNSSRHVQVVIDGVTVADTSRPRLLFETNMVTRYYIPKEDVRMDLLVPSEKHTQCPYKGRASYYSADVGGKFYENIAWYYPFPIPECPKIENLVAFFSENEATIYVDGEKV